MTARQILSHTHTLKTRFSPTHTNKKPRGKCLGASYLAAAGSARKRPPRRPPREEKRQRSVRCHFAHSPSRFVLLWLATLALHYSRFGLQRVRKTISIDQYSSLKCVNRWVKERSSRYKCASFESDSTRARAYSNGSFTMVECVPSSNRITVSAEVCISK